MHHLRKLRSGLARQRLRPRTGGRARACSGPHRRLRTHAGSGERARCSRTGTPDARAARARRSHHARDSRHAGSSSAAGRCSAAYGGRSVSSRRGDRSRQRSPDKPARNADADAARPSAAHLADRTSRYRSARYEHHAPRFGRTASFSHAPSFGHAPSKPAALDAEKRSPSDQTIARFTLAQVMAQLPEFSAIGR